MKFLQSLDILPSSIQCPGPLVDGKRTSPCGHPMSLRPTKDRKDGMVWRCRKKHVVGQGKNKKNVNNVKVSIRFNTWLQDSNLSLQKIVEFIYLWAQGYSNANIHHELKLSHATIIEWTAYFRDICQYHVMKSSTTIGGEGVHVEIDESKFGRRKYYKGKRVLGQWIFGGREVKDKSKIFMVPVKRRDARTLLPLIIRWIAKGSIIHSDCWKAYSKINKLGYTHVTVNHSKEFKNKATGACTNRIESEWRHAKVSLPPYGVHKGLHAGYLSEFMWKRMHYKEDLFLMLLKHINEAYVGGHFTCMNK